MKRKFLLFISMAFFACFNGHAQISKGSIFLGGQLSFNSVSTNYATPNSDNQKNTAFSFSPSIGKAIKDNTVVGISLYYAYNKNNQYASPENATTNSFGAGVFMRRYVPLGKGFYVFGQGTFSGFYSSGKTDTSQTGSFNGYYNAKGYSFGFYFYPGISYQVSKHLQLETGFNNILSIGFNHNSFYEPGTNGGFTEIKTNAFNVDASLNNLVSFTIGFRVLLASK